jgi:Tol biopolymer transport system component
MDADGTHIRRMTRTEGSEHNPDWSPDGSRVVFADPPDIRLLSIPSGELTTLTTAAIRPRRGPAAYPAWSPDGRWIAFTCFAPSALNGIVGYAGVWVVRADGTGERRISEGPLQQRWYVAPTWSPDGSSIVASLVTDSGLAIVDVRSSGISYLDTPRPLRDLSWSNEGIIGSGESYEQPLWSPS